MTRWAALLALALGVAVLARASIRGPASKTPCERAVRKGELQHGVDLCLASYERTRDPHDLSWAAEAYLGMNKLEPAGDIARRLLAGPRAADGHRILSNVLLRTSRPGALKEAEEHANAAVDAYRSAGNDRGLTSALLAVSQAAWKLGRSTKALEAADEMLNLAERLGSARNVATAHVLRADALRRMGDWEAAEEALQRAGERATTACDRTWVHLKTGMLQMEKGRDVLARLELEAAEKANGECRHPAASISIELNMARLLRWKDPAKALEKLHGVEKSDGEGLETLLLRGYLAADRGAFDEAEDYFARAEAAEAPDADWLWEVAQARAELAELRGGQWGELLAEYHYRRAIGLVTALRPDSTERDAHLVSSHRAPYDGLIALLARTDRWRDALAVVLELDASDMLRATAAEVVPYHRDVIELERPAAHRPPSAHQPASAPQDIDELLAAWGSRDLVIALAPAPRQIGPGRERAYRLRLTGGRITGEEAGDASMVRRWAEELYTDPSDQNAARSLGRVLVPPDKTGEPLDVLAIGVLGKAPLAALRDEDGALLVSRRPLARVLALRSETPAPTAAAEAPIVIADPIGDLPAAAYEGFSVAGILHPNARLYGPLGFQAANQARLLEEAKHAYVLHIAAHVNKLEDGPVLQLADKVVTPKQIAKAKLAPRLAVLASCGSAAAQDEEGWGSIAAALLEGGTETVIATDRSVPDEKTLQLMHAFYAQPDWRTHPARALARVQAALATSWPAKETQEWAAFTVFRRPPG